MKYNIDSTDKSLGRVATEAATILMGKNTPAYTRNTAPKVEVHITNASKVKLTSKKLEETVYKHHTGYRGNLKGITMGRFIEEKGYKELFRKTIYGMLPTNKLRAEMIKNLYVTE